MRKSLRVAVLLFPLLGLSVARAEGVGMSTTWFDTALTKAQCIQRATTAVKAAGFTANFELVGSGIFADNEDYTVNFRCIPEKKIAFVVVAGPDSDLADEYVTEIEKAYGDR